MNAPGPVLRDIHLPHVGWWPPAPGWWLLFALALALFALGLWQLRRAWRRRRWRAALHAELAALAAAHASNEDDAELARGLSALLRRAALRRQPSAAALHGAAWLDFLERIAPGALAREHAEALQRATYVPHAHLHAATLIAACTRWLEHAVVRDA